MTVKYLYVASNRTVASELSDNELLFSSTFKFVILMLHSIETTLRCDIAARVKNFSRIRKRFEWWKAEETRANLNIDDVITTL